MLTVREIEQARPREKPYRLNDGGSLYLVVRPSGAKSWEYRYKAGGQVRAVVLGSYGSGDSQLGLKAAREKRDAERMQIKDGSDPATRRKIRAEAEKAELEELRRQNQEKQEAARRAREEAAAAARTLKAVAEAWQKAMLPHWTAEHAHQVDQSLTDHAFPKLGDKAIAAIEPKDIIEILSGMLADRKVETARRVRQRLDAIFEQAVLHHKLPGNPVAAARREINKLVKAARRANPEANFPCVPVAEVPQLLRAMRAYVGTPTTRSLLWFVALTGCRTGEARYATWDEFVLAGDDPHWLIPAERMKAGKPHRVPLAPEVVEILKALPRGRWLFPHPTKADRPCSENAILYALAAIGYRGRMSGHGFRSLFSTLANASRLHDADIIEAALAHGDPDRIRETYNKASRIEQHKAIVDLYGDARRKLANWYAAELARLEAGATAKVTELRPATA